MILFRMENVAFVVLFIVECRSTSPNYNSFSNPSISLPSLRGRGKGVGLLWDFSLKTQTF